MKAEKLFISILVCILSLPIAFSYVGWIDGENGWDGQKQFPFQSADLIFESYTDNQQSVLNGTLQPIVADLATGGKMDVAIAGVCNLYLTDAELNLKSNSTYMCDRGQVIDSLIGYNWDGDAQDIDILVFSHNNTFGFLHVFEVNSDYSMSHKSTYTTTYPTTNKHAVCWGTYCYIQDINSNLYRFEKGTGTKTAINLGSLSGDIHASYLTIDRCDEGDPTDNPIMLAQGDFDGDGFFNDVSVINLTTFTEIGSVNFFDDYTFISPVTCGDIEGTDYGAVTTVDISQVIHDYGMYSTTECFYDIRAWYFDPYNLTSKATYLLTTSSIEISSGGYDNCLKSYYENNVNQASQPIFGADDDKVYFAKADNLCSYNLTQSFNCTSNFGETGLFYNRLWSGYSYNKFNNIGVLYHDWDDDGDMDFITPKGNLIRYTDYDQISYYGDMSIANSPVDIIVFGDDESFADYAVRKSAIGTYSIYYDVLGNISTNSLPTINSVTASPNPQNVSKVVEWTCSITDSDNNASDVWSAFDCDTSTSALDYVWGFRGTSPVYNCTYGVAGGYTGKCWASDVDNYPKNTSISSGVTIQNESVDLVAYVIDLFTTTDPAYVGGNVTWIATYGDDESASGLWSAFDCDNDGILEYNWSQRASFQDEFVCLYGSVGLKTARVWVSDDGNYPEFNNTLTETVQINTASGEADCTGFTSPSCTGSCVFYDNFNYNYSILCNRWQGKNVFPYNESYLKIVSPEIGEQLYLDLSTQAIESWEYDTFSIEFEFRQNDLNLNYMFIYEKNAGKTLAELNFDGGQLYAYVGQAPYEYVIGYYNVSQWNTVKATFDFVNKNIVFIYNGEEAVTAPFKNEDAESFGYIQFFWSVRSAVDWDTDEFLIETGTENVDGVEPEEEVDYTFNPSLFCAINWTAPSGERFKEEYCSARGYSVEYPLLSLCIPRACFADMSSYLIQKATDNILDTIIILIVIILLAPLAIMLYSKTRGR